MASNGRSGPMWAVAFQLRGLDLDRQRGYTDIRHCSAGGRRAHLEWPALCGLDALGIRMLGAGANWL